MRELHLGVGAYFAFYNSERPHQSLGYKTPDAVYQSGQGGGAKIVDKFGKGEEIKPVNLLAAASALPDLAAMALQVMLGGSEDWA